MYICMRVNVNVESKIPPPKGLKYTENKPFGRHYLGVTHTTMSSAKHTLTEVKACFRIMADVV